MLKRELKINLKSFIIWTSIMAGTLILVFTIYPTMMLNMGNIDEMMKMFPEEILKAFNMDLYSLNTALGWIQTEGYVFWVLIGAIYACLLGSTILCKEESEGTIAFLYAKPITRNKIVTSRILCGSIYVIAFNLVMFIVCMVGLAFCGTFDEGKNIDLVIIFSLAPIVLHIALFSLMLLLSVFFNKTKKIRSIALGFAFGEYLLQMIGSVSSDLEIIQKISLFEVTSMRYMSENISFNWIYLILEIVIIGIAFLGTYYFYNKKEFHC